MQCAGKQPTLRRTCAKVTRAEGNSCASVCILQVFEGSPEQSDEQREVLASVARTLFARSGDAELEPPYPGAF